MPTNTVEWPVEVPQYAEAGSLQEQPERNVSEFQPRFGPPMVRRRTSVPTDIISFVTHMSFDQYDVLMDWFREELATGSLPFLRKHPRDPTGPEDYTFMFTDSPKLRDAGPFHCRVELALRLLY